MLERMESESSKLTTFDRLRWAGFAIFICLWTLAGVIAAVANFGDSLDVVTLRLGQVQVTHDCDSSVHCRCESATDSEFPRSEPANRKETPLRAPNGCVAPAWHRTFIRCLSVLSH
jgi:hypothetical protein